MSKAMSVERSKGEQSSVSPRSRAAITEQVLRFSSRSLWLEGWFSLYFLYVWLRIEPTLEYYSLSPVFFTSGAFFREHLSYPGGLLQYGAAFMTELYRVSLLGALITTGIAASLGFLARSLLRSSGWQSSWLAMMGPGVFLLIAQTDYSFSWLQPTLAALFALTFACTYARLAPLEWRLRLVVFFALWLPLYFVAAGGYLLFSVTCALLETAWNQTEIQGNAPPIQHPPLARICLPLLYLGAGAFIPFAAANWLFVVTQRDAYLLHVPLQAKNQAAIGAVALFTFLPALLLARNCRSLVLRALTVSPNPTPPPQRHAGDLAAEHPRQKRRPPPAAGSLTKPQNRTLSLRALLLRVLAGKGPSWKGYPVLWFGLGALCIACTFNGQQKVLARIEYRADQQQWPELLQAAQELRLDNRAAISDINHALCHTDRLLEDMFRYPQRRGFELWLNLKPTVLRNKLHKSSELLFELGHINRAERMAAESLEINGYKPATLKKLFLISILRGEPQSGMPFLNLLRQTLWDRNWAERYDRALAADPQLSGDPALNQVRPLMLTRDYLGALENTVLLEACLRQNPTNRMAAEYLLASYLLEGQIESVAANLACLGSGSNPGLPRHVQEALLLSQLAGKKVDLRSVKFNPTTVERFDAFQRAYAPYQDNPSAGEAPLARDFGDTYWYFYVYGHSGCLPPRRTTQSTK